MGTMKAVLPAVVAVALVACAAPPAPVPSTDRASATAMAQVHVCGEHLVDCEEIISVVVAKVPAMAASRIAAADFRELDAWKRRGGSAAVLVAFEPVGDADYWFNPPTWLVTVPMFSRPMTVEPWQAGTLPPHFIELLRKAGLRF